MSVINHFCSVYQMFTDPRVYSYMWSLHPSLCVDEVYAVLLGRLHPNLARLPWARTNRALRGRTEGTRLRLNPRGGATRDARASRALRSHQQAASPAAEHPCGLRCSARGAPGPAPL